MSPALQALEIFRSLHKPNIYYIILIPVEAAQKHAGLAEILAWVVSDIGLFTMSFSTGPGLWAGPGSRSSSTGRGMCNSDKEVIKELES